MKYIVMENWLSHSVVLDEDGRFLKVANRNYQLGQTVTDVIEMNIPEPLAPATREQKKRSTWMRSLAAVATVFVLVFTSMFQLSRTVHASLYMSINPEVKIEVNRFNRVISLEGINEDGRDLIEDYDYKNKKLEPLMDELIERAIDRGYLHEGGKVTLTLDSKSDKWVASHSESLSTQLSELINSRLPADSVEVEIIDMKAAPETTEPDDDDIDNDDDDNDDDDDIEDFDDDDDDDNDNDDDDDDNDNDDISDIDDDADDDDDDIDDDDNDIEDFDDDDDSNDDDNNDDDYDDSNDDDDDDDDEDDNDDDDEIISE